MVRVAGLAEQRLARMRRPDLGGPDARPATGADRRTRAADGVRARRRRPRRPGCAGRPGPPHPGAAGVDAPAAGVPLFVLHVAGAAQPDAAGRRATHARPAPARTGTARGPGDGPRRRPETRGVHRRCAGAAGVSAVHHDPHRDGPGVGTDRGHRSGQRGPAGPARGGPERRRVPDHPRRVGRNPGRRGRRPAGRRGRGGAPPPPPGRGAPGSLKPDRPAHQGLAEGMAGPGGQTTSTRSRACWTPRA